MTIHKSVCLISLPSPFEEEPAMDIPLGIGYIISYLKSKNISDIKYVDFNTKRYDYYNDTKYLENIPLDYNIYGISLSTPHYFWFYQTCLYIRKHNPGSIIIAGGPHASSRPEECILRGNKKLADYAIIGEGEEAFYDIIKGDINRDGIYFKDHFNKNRRIIKDLGSLPFPDRSLVNIKDYRRTIKGSRALHMITSRDCSFNCTFCSKKAIGRSIRHRTTDNIIEEVDFYISEYGIRNIVLYDDTFTINKERAKKIAIELGKREVTWRCFSRTDTVDKDLLGIFKDNGISSITFGVESFSDKMLKIYNKETTSLDNKKALLTCKEIEIPVRCSLIYGGPFETIDTLKETIHGIRETQPDEWNIATFVPIPGSDIGDNPNKYKIKIYEDPFYLKYHRVGESGMGNILANISTMTPEEYIKNREWFIRELESVCPRKIIQDTIQDLKPKLT